MTQEIRNPLTKTLITKLREQKTDAFVFRHTVKEITKQLAFEALKDFNTVKKEITTWQGEKSFDTLDQSSLIAVTVLRAGLPMIESITDLLPDIRGGFLAMKRNETTHESVLYYDRVPECKGKTILLVDPMLATGGSMCDAIELLKKKGASKIIGLNIIGSPEGIERLEKEHPDVDIFVAQIDEKLNENKFIIPGLGDAGDRSYNTLE